MLARPAAGSASSSMVFAPLLALLLACGAAAAPRSAVICVCIDECPDSPLGRQKKGRGGAADASLDGLMALGEIESSAGHSFAFAERKFRFEQGGVTFADKAECTAPIVVVYEEKVYSHKDQNGKAKSTKKEVARSSAAQPLHKLLAFLARQGIKARVVKDDL